MKTPRSGSNSARKRQEPKHASDTHGESALSHMNPHDNQDLAVDAPHYQTFTVRFLIDPRAGCRRTDVSSVQQGQSDTWSGYDPDRLIAWIGSRIAPEPGLATPAAPPLVAAEATAAAPSIPTVIVQPEPPKRMQPLLHELTIAQSESRSLCLIEAGTPLTVRYTFEVPGNSNEWVGYTARILIRGLGSTTQLFGEQHNQAHYGVPTVVEMTGIAPAPGMYRLTAGVDLALPGAYTASLTGMLVHVYDSGASNDN